MARIIAITSEIIIVRCSDLRGRAGLTRNHVTGSFAASPGSFRLAAYAGSASQRTFGDRERSMADALGNLPYLHYKKLLPFEKLW